MSILAVNAGSSTVKLSLFDDDARTLLKSATHEARDASAFLSGFAGSDVERIRVVGHRFVHGGTRFVEPVQTTPDIASELKALSELAPLHNPASIRELQRAQSVFPHAMHVAVFDTAFFSKLPERAFVYPTPYDWYAEFGIRRFGFHGINHEYCARRAAEMTRAARVIICHLGSGCSATAIHSAQPIATTMGLTPMEGLMMATRAGSLDPGILFHLARQGRSSLAELEDALNHRSGLLGVSGISADYREVEKAASEGNARARLACELFEDRIVSAIGSLAALLGGVEALVFTGGTGENRSMLRSAVCQRLRWLGLELDAERNAKDTPDVDIASTQSRIRVLVIRAREDLMIAEAARRLYSTGLEGRASPRATPLPT